MSGITISADSGTQFKNGAAEWNTIAKLDADNYVVAYRDNANGNRGTINVGSRTGTSVTISAVNAQIFNNDSTDYISVIALSATKIIISYHDVNSGSAYVIAGTISGTTITFGSAVLLKTESTVTPSLAALDSSNFVATISFFSTTSKVSSYVSSVSGTTITLGSEQSVTTDGGRANSIALDSTHIAVCFLRASTNLAKIVICSVDTGLQTITAGGIVNIGNCDDNVNKPLMGLFDSTHIIVGYLYSAFSGYTDLFLNAISVNLTTLLPTVGSAIRNTTSLSTDSNYSLCTINLVNFIIAYYTTTGTEAELRAGTLSGSTTLTFDAQGAVIFDNSTSSYTALCALNSTDFIVAVKEG